MTHPGPPPDYFQGWCEDRESGSHPPPGFTCHGHTGKAEAAGAMMSEAAVADALG